MFLHEHVLRSVTAVGLSTLLILGARPAQGQEAQKPTSTETRTRALKLEKNTDPKAKPKTTKPDLYSTKLDADTQLKTAIAKAKRDHSRVLVMFGFNTCGWCHKLHDLFQKDQEIRTTLRNEYVTAMVDIAAPHADEWLKKCSDVLTKEERAKGVGFPFLAVIDADGKIITAQRTDPFEVDGHHDAAKVKGFLKQWAVAPQVAQKLVDDGIARAGSENKRVFLHFGAPWCGWCHKLEDFLAQDQIAAAFSRDYIDIKVDTDRMTGGQELLTKYRGSEQGGIPWFVVLDANGKALATSDGPKGNIGYPAQPEEIDHFVAVLRKTARNLEPQAIDQIKAALQAASKPGAAAH